MKKLKQDLKAVNKELKALVKKTENLMEAVDRVEKAKATKPKKASPKKAIKSKAVTKVAGKITPTKKRSVKPTDTDKVLNIIKKSKKGITAQTLSKKTGFDAKKIANMVFRATKMGKIKSVSKGVYVGV
jgi:predicted Rossmann fold nucleotide-binding protein DprA/Smf involved in DNA uptake